MVLIVPSLVTERIESVKAGVIGAGAFAIAELIMVIVKGSVIILLPGLTFTTSLFNGIWLVQLAIGAISGFLFGVTYRYVIRDDHNSHLSDGAVLAFGLVRGLALVEKSLTLSELLSLGTLVIQSIICFAIARSIIDLAIARKLIKPFV